ncbi:hypothetical protein PL263_12445 [Methylomonas sp. EFPC3]|uniref:hypothetical protein n=1 Tax=Methylomonas sp. EFPC3 TaxID=3021710 RepID=UPI0024174E2E|nr:hypothetical protein [Methylomonas sp. EFPC3]WFP48915.1 hypothetical protein PL263_12445 [Methylomonas sp. EFPC3]
MVDLLPVFIDATMTLQQLMKQWFAAYPAGMPWTIVSDYCIGDNGKKNDVFSFVVIANHDKTENISEYLSAVAPRDIKNTRQVPWGLMQYLTCPEPVTFSVSFVIDRDSALLRDYLRIEHMSCFIPDACEFVESLRKNSPAHASLDPTYFDDVLKRLSTFERDLARKQLNAKLSRQIHLASGFAATMFYLVTQATRAGYLRWISDRDKLIEHNDTVVYDLAFLYFILMSSSQLGQETTTQGNLILDVPNINFELPNRTGEHRFDALIRLPDYLAGTLADIGPDMSYSKKKFGEMLYGVFVDSPNNWVVQLTSNGEKISARSMQYRS